MKTIDNSNLTISVLHLRSASELLKNDEPELSLALLRLAKSIIEKHNLLNSSFEESQKILDSIEDGKQQT